MFNQSANLGLLILLPVMLAFFAWRLRQRQIRIRRLGDQTLLASLINRQNFQRYYLKLGLWLLTITMLIIGLAQPVWGLSTSQVEVRGIAIMIVLDVSASMDAEDVLPSRLERAKLAVREIIEANVGDEFGLVLFAGTSFVQLPLTSDVNSAISFLNAVTTDSIGQQGTSLASALRLAVDSVDIAIAEQSIILVFSDGENHQGEPIEIAEEANEQGIIIHAVGYGDPIDGAPIPIRDENDEIVSYKSDQLGNLVLTRLNEDVLREVADVTTGTYQRATDSGIEIINLLNTVSEVEEGSLGSRVDARRVERFGIFIVLAIVFLSFEMMLSEAKTSNE